VLKFKEVNKKMEQLIIWDPEKCCGCRRCEKICSWVHEGVFSKARARVSCVKWETEGVYLPLSCFQCETAFCMAVCPVGAIAKDEMGVVIIDEEKCVNCRLCYKPQCVEECPTEALRLAPLDERAGLLKRRTAMNTLRKQREAVLDKTTFD